MGGAYGRGGVMDGAYGMGHGRGMWLPNPLDVFDHHRTLVLTRAPAISGKM